MSVFGKTERPSSWQTEGSQWGSVSRRMASAWTFVEALPGPAVVMDGQGVLVIANSAWRALFPSIREDDNYLGWLREKASDSGEGLEQDRLTLAAWLGQLGDLLEGRTLRAEGTFVAPVDPLHDGAASTVLTAHGAIHDGLALICHTVVTEHVRQREGAEALAKRYETILSQLPMGLYIKDSSLRYMAVNDAYCTLMGWEMEEVIGQTDAELYGSHNGHQVMALEETLLQSARHHVEQIKVQRDGKTLILVEEKRAVYKENGEVLGLLGVLTDSTELEGLKKDKATYKQAVSDAQKTQDHFLANISHEIRTPMNALSGLIHVLEQTRLSKRQQDVVRRLRTAIQSLLGIMNDVIDVAALEGGRLRLSPAPVNLGELVESLDSALRPLAQEQGLCLHMALAPDVPRVLELDGLRLQQILVHLLGNAIKFTPSGDVLLTASLVDRHQDGDQTTARICFEVRDTGIGISAEQQKALFQLFHQVDTSSTRRYGGVGLGLALSSRLINMMGGHIQVQSQLGEGSSFRFTLTLPETDERGLCGEGRVDSFAVSPEWTDAQRDPGAMPPAADPNPGFGAAVDVEDALARLEGDRPLLAELMSQFCEDNLDTAGQILVALDEGDLEQAAALAHSLKGTAANLGAHGLASVAEAVVRTARAGDSEGALAVLVTLRRQLLAVIRECEEARETLVESGMSVPQDLPLDLDMSYVGIQVKHLETLLCSNSMDALDAFEVVQGVLLHLVGSAKVQELERHIHRLDFSGALKALKLIVNDVEINQSVTQIG